MNNLLSEFNPEIAEKARTRMDLDINEIEGEEWYPFKNMRQYIEQVSDDAQRAVGKMMVRLSSEDAEMPDPIPMPTEVIKSLVLDLKTNHRKDNYFEAQFLEEGDEFIKMRYDTEGMVAYYEGIFEAILNMYEIYRVHIKTIVEEEKETQQISLMEIKWEF
ncbi:MAG: hypothetical protein ACFE96_15010 [Candidatus Hermodarchaeota archaeon]